jgi:hypothetical protein
MLLGIEGLFSERAAADGNMVEEIHMVHHQECGLDIKIPNFQVAIFGLWWSSFQRNMLLYGWI